MRSDMRGRIAKRPGERAIALFGIVAGVGSLMLLSGCAGNCAGDPRFDSAGCAASALLTGKYDDDTEAMRKKAEEADARAAALRKENEKLNQRMATLDRQEREAARKLRNSNEKLAGLIAQLAEARKEKKKSAAELAELDAKLKALEERHMAASESRLDSTVRAEIDQLEKDVNKLQHILETG